MQEIKFPINFEFKIGTLANDFTVKDATGKTIAYVRQKMFKFKEEVLVYQDETKTKVNYKIKADKWLDFSTAYKFTDNNGNFLGKVVRKGWKSLWKAEYKIIDQNDQLQYTISEDNPMAKVFDNLLGEIPIIGFFTGYLFNPKYSVKNEENQIVQIRKEPSFFGRKFQVTEKGEMDSDDDDRIMLSLMMMVLLERRRG